MWATAILWCTLLASGTSATFLDLLGRANRLCPAVVDTITVSLPAVTVTVTSSLPLSTLPTGTRPCLSDAQATNIVNSWKAIIMHSDRDAAKTTAEKLIADEFLLTGDSINSLAGIAVSVISLSSLAPLLYSAQFEVGLIHATAW
jgi:hypothetical protein